MQNTQGNQLEIVRGKFTAKDINNLISALAACQIAQKIYGKSAEDLDVQTEVFLLVLSKYEPSQVIAAIEVWLGKSDTFPTPYDIKEIIDPEPVYDKTIYLSLQKKKEYDPDGMRDADWRYIREYENYNRKNF